MLAHLQDANTRQEKPDQVLENVTTRSDTINLQPMVMLKLLHGQTFRMLIVLKLHTKLGNKQVDLYTMNAGQLQPLEHIIQQPISSQMCLDVK